MQNQQNKREQKLQQLKRMILDTYSVDIKGVEIQCEEAPGKRSGTRGLLLNCDLQFADPRIDKQTVSCPFTHDMSVLSTAVMFRPIRGAINQIITAAYSSPITDIIESTENINEL